MSLKTLKWAATICFVVAMGLATAQAALRVAYFLIRTYPHLKRAEIRDDESVWERLGIEL